MTAPATWTTDLLTGIAARIDALGIGTWRPAGAYTASDEPAVYRGSVGSEVDRAIGLRVYSPVDDPGLGITLQPVQFYLRGARNAGPDSVEAIGGALFNAFHGVEKQVFSGIEVALMWRNSAVPLGVDSLDRETAAHNYYLRAMRRTVSRPY